MSASTNYNRLGLGQPLEQTHSRRTDSSERHQQRHRYTGPNQCMREYYASLLGDKRTQYFCTYYPLVLQGKACPSESTLIAFGDDVSSISQLEMERKHYPDVHMSERRNNLKQPQNRHESRMVKKMNETTVRVSAIKAELYRRGCMVTFTGEATLSKGVNVMLIEGLPNDFDANYIHLHMPEHISLRHVSRVSGSKHSDDVDTSELDAAIDELKRLTANKNTELESWTHLISNIQSIDGLSVFEYLERFPPKLDMLTKEIASLKKECETKTHERDEKRAEHNMLNNARLSATLEVQSEGTFPLEIICRSQNAHWSPAFDILVDDIDGPMKLRMKGMIVQETGIDWKQVTLSLNTSTPSLFGNLTRFSSRYLYPKAKQKHLGSSALIASQASLMRTQNANARDMSSDSTSNIPAASTTSYSKGGIPEVLAPQATIVEQAISRTYRLPEKQDLKGDGSQQIVFIETNEYAARFYYYTYPEQDETAYLIAHLNQDLPPETLEEPLSIYIAGSYMGSIRIAGLTGEERCELPLGRDDMIVVQRRTSNRQSSRILSGKNIDYHETTISIKNNKQNTINLIVLGQVPLSQDDSIKVVLQESQGASFNKESGKLCWETQLKPHEQITLSSSYMVSYAKGQIIESHEDYRSGNTGLPYCPNCGCSLDKGIRFCPVCGYNINTLNV